MVNYHTQIREVQPGAEAIDRFLEFASNGVASVSNAMIKDDEFEGVEYPWGHPNFVISNSNPNNKYTFWCRRCIAIVLLGDSIGEQKPISVLTHVAPRGVMKFFNPFLRELIRSMHAFRDSTTPDSRSISIAGGFYKFDLLNSYGMEYRSRVLQLANLFEDCLDVPARVILPPKFQNCGNTNVICYTAEKRMVVVQDNPSGALQIQPFNASDLKKEIRNWKSLNLA